MIINMKHDKTKNTVQKNPDSKKTILVTMVSIIAIFVSGLYLNFSWYKYEKKASSEAIVLAQSIKALLHNEHIVKLTGSEADLKNPVYIMAKNSMSELVKITNPIHFAYLYKEQDGKIIFLMDSESPDSPNYSPPGQIYNEADDIFYDALVKNETIVTKQITDNWGTWISVLVPISDPADNKVLAVFGIDYSASEWYSTIWRQMIYDIIIVVILLILFVSLIIYAFQHNILKRMSKKLAYEEAFYHSVFDQAPIGIAIMNDKDFANESLFGNKNINAMYEEILGRTSSELKKLKWTDVTHPEDLQADLEKFEQFKKGEINSYSMEKRFIRPDGTSVWTNMKVSPLLGGLNSESMHLCLIEDISARKITEASYRESERSKSVLLSHLPGMAYRCNYDKNWTMQFVSAGCYELTGYSSENLLYNRDLSFNDLINPEYREHLWNDWGNILPDKKPFKNEYEITTSTGERKWVLELGQGVYNEHGEVEALEGIILDITNRKEMENVLKFNSEHDVWTGLYNRKYLNYILEKDRISGILQNKALVGINLSSIHLVSLKYGFQYSQELLKKVAEILKTHCDDKHSLFYTYEYRFLFYVKEYTDRKELIDFCETIIATLESILTVERINGGIGVIEIDKDNDPGIESLTRNLLIASEKALSNYESNFAFCFFDDDMAAEIIREDNISRELSQVVAGEKVERLYLQYQPILDVVSNKICGFEALARFNSDKYGPVSPLEFIPIAEKNKFIVTLGEIIIQKAIGFLKNLKHNGYDSISISINVSAIQLLKNNFAINIIELIKSSDVNPHNVGLEITESVFSSNYQEINAVLGQLRDFGIKIAIDDFGTGYSSLARERELNVNCLKIDKYFIDKILAIDPDCAITGDIISMAHKMGHFVVAEGVEHEIQKQYLESLGCDKIQGYLIGRPLNQEIAIEILLKQKDDTDCLIT